MHPFDPHRRRLAFSLALALALPGCAGVQWRRGSPSSTAEGPPDDVIRSWRATGKLTARIGDGGRRWGATLDWRQKRDNFRIRLSGPLGQGALQLKGRPGKVELTTPRGKRRSAPTTEALLVQELGWELPASSLRYWITARARPEVPVRNWSLDRAGRLASLDQQGWQIDYEYGGERGEHLLPDRVNLRGGEGVVLRIAIRDWRVE